MNTRPTDPYAGLRASRARATAALRQPASPKRSAAPEDRSYEHLHGATLRCWTERQPITPHPPTQEEAAHSFAERMEQVAAQVAGRKPRDVVTGPRQGQVKATGADLIAAQRRREAERAAAVRRR